MGRFAGRCTRLRAARRRVHETSGFTIIEVLIAMIVLLIGMLGTFLLVGTANGSLSKTKAREGATNLTRELLESSRETAYANVGQSGWFTSTLQNTAGGSGSVTFPATNSARTTVTRRKVSYTATVSWCSVDDNGDGYGTHASSTSWCSGSGTTGTADSQAEDFKRVSATVSWTFKGVTQPTLTQTATFSSTGAVVGPSVSSLAITSPSGLDPNTPTITSNPSGGIVTTLGSATGAADMKFSINGVEQSSGVTNNGNGTWSFNWNITTLADGNYTISAAAIDALGTRGPPRSLTVKLARGPATAPQNVTGGYNYVYVSGVKTLVVELGWDASPEGSVTGYEVRNGATVECSASLATDCIDLTAASSGSTTYQVRTNYTDSSGTAQFVSTNYTVTAPTTMSFVKNIGQGAPSCANGPMTITVPAGGVAAGNTVIVRLMRRGNSGAAVSASDSRANTYTAGVDTLNVDQRIVVLSAYLTTALVAGDTITVNHPNGPQAVGAVADAFSGVAQSGALDGSGTGAGTTNSPSASVTTNTAQELLIGGVSMAGNLTGTQPLGWTALTGQIPILRRGKWSCHEPWGLRDRLHDRDLCVQPGNERRRPLGRRHRRLQGQQLRWGPAARGPDRPYRDRQRRWHAHASLDEAELEQPRGRLLPGLSRRPELHRSHRHRRGHADLSLVDADLLDRHRYRRHLAHIPRHLGLRQSRPNRTSSGR